MKQSLVWRNYATNTSGRVSASPSAVRFALKNDLHVTNRSHTVRRQSIASLGFDFDCGSPSDDNLQSIRHVRLRVGKMRRSDWMA